ncbi:MAG: efflux RND transporter periplasmic adaptor subunit [Bacteroidales bacterium]|nr:efflux RND transporter periplasmic adaptor subunit [Bacteroidales bacterium]
MKKTFILLAALAVTCSCGNYNNRETTAATAEVVSKVETQAAYYQTIVLDQVYSSTVQAFAVNNIAPQSVGRIRNLGVEVGQFVSKGQTVATMDELQYSQAKIKYENDLREYERLKALLDEGGVAQSDYDQIEMALTVSKSTLENLEQNTYLRSPISGVVTARNYDKGDMYSMGMPIYTVQQITPVKLLVPVSESDYSKVKVGTEATLTADALPGLDFNGRIVRLYPTIDPATHTFSAEVNVANSGRELRPGMFARVKLDLGSSRNIVVPDAAIVKQQGSGRRAVFVLREDGKVQEKMVRLGRHIGDTYVIESGLEEGEKVVVKGASTLKQGQKVEEIQYERN